MFVNEYNERRRVGIRIHNTHRRVRDPVGGRPCDRPPQKSGIILQGHGQLDVLRCALARIRADHHVFCDQLSLLGHVLFVI